MTARAPRITKRAEGGFAVALDSPSGYAHVDTWPTFDEARDWAVQNRSFLWTFVEHDGDFDIYSDPPRGVKLPWR